MEEELLWQLVEALLRREAFVQHTQLTQDRPFRSIQPESGYRSHMGDDISAEVRIHVQRLDRTPSPRTTGRPGYRCWSHTDMGIFKRLSDLWHGRESRPVTPDEYVDRLRKELRYDPLAVQEDVCVFRCRPPHRADPPCLRPPPGWHCHLPAGHEGPCPTWADAEDMP